MVDREMTRDGEGTRADEERGGTTLPGSGRCAGRCARPGANAHRLPIRRRPQGSSRPRMSKSDTKGFQRTGRMNENLGIMRLCFVRMRTTQAFVSDLDIHGSFRAPALVPSGPRWGRHRQRGPGNSVSSPRRRARPRPRANAHVAKTVDLLRVRARARPGAAGPAGHARPAPGRVSPQGPPARLRPGGRGPHRARSGSAGPGPRRAPTAPGSPPEGRSPPQDAARRPPAPRGPAHS